MKDDIEVTGEMIAAGCREFMSHDTMEPLAETLRAVYIAMAMAKRIDPPAPEPMPAHRPYRTRSVG